MRQRLCGLALIICFLSAGPGVRVAVGAESAAGETRIARWQDDKTACFLLMFDDSYPSHWQVAAPELVKRGLIATFYICPGKGEYTKYASHWEQELWKQGMVYAVHTMTHKGIKDLDNAEYEIGECERTILRITPGKEPRLISFGMPGLAKGAWNITPEQTKQMLEKYHLIDRPTFVGHGAVFHLKTPGQMLALAEKAIADKGMEYLVIHGVERITPNWGFQDFWALKQDILFKVLDGLKERQDKGDLWITDHISQYKYEKERDSASVKILEATDQTIRLDLTASADPKLFDLPLTLVIKTPPSWKKAKVTQGDQSTTVDVREGFIRFQAVPNSGPVRLAQP